MAIPATPLFSYTSGPDGQVPPVNDRDSNKSYIEPDYQKVTLEPGASCKQHEKAPEVSNKTTQPLTFQFSGSGLTPFSEIKVVSQKGYKRMCPFRPDTIGVDILPHDLENVTQDQINSHYDVLYQKITALNNELNKIQLQLTSSEPIPDHIKSSLIERKRDALGKKIALLEIIKDRSKLVNSTREDLRGKFIIKFIYRTVQNN